MVTSIGEDAIQQIEQAAISLVLQFRFSDL